MKKIILFFFLLIFATTSQAYWWRFSNFTPKILLLKVKLLASNNPYYAIVLPNQSALFDWSPPNPMAGFCLDKTIEWIEATPSILSNRDVIDADYTIVSNDKMNELFFGPQASFTLNKTSINYFSSELYKKTVAHAGAIFGKGFMKWAASMYAKSACKSRHISIVENNDGSVEFITQKN